MGHHARPTAHPDPPSAITPDDAHSHPATNPVRAESLRTADSRPPTVTGIHASHPHPTTLAARSVRAVPAVRVETRPTTHPQPPTGIGSHEDHPHPTTVAARSVRAGSTRAPHRHHHPRRTPLRALLAALLTAAIVIPLAGAARPAIPAPPPAHLATSLTPSALSSAYAANRKNAADAARMAAAHGDTRRAAADRALAAPARRLLAFDGRGHGHVIEVMGDLAHARRIAVLVPGSDTTLDTYPRFHRAAASLYTALTHRPTEGRAPENTAVAVIAWLGYDTPATVSTTVTTTTRADEAAPRLRAFVRHLRTAAPATTHLTLLCHSYGSVVCGRAAPGLAADDIALIGSPGTGADSAADLHSRARVWAARGSDDWVAHVPHIRTGLFGTGTTVGFDTDPVSAAFGARVFDAAGADHSGYFTPGSASLANLARITLGETSEVTGD
ncbi:alpha/beta hydrolase [Streptomyces sp. NPDC017638]|uniref:alpha/beta hydrolase n=1 Tax=Streptomyces sp. NPDC017638 TaxID=3365004 RepID=UPI00378FFCEE